MVSFLLLTKTLQAVFIPMRATYAVPLILLDLVILLVSGNEHKLWSSALRSFLQLATISNLFSHTFRRSFTLLKHETQNNNSARTHQVNYNATIQAAWWVYSKRDIYKRNQHSHQHACRVVAGSNTSTVALTAVGGDEKGIQCLGG
jgi:hypothetical protein